MKVKLSALVLVIVMLVTASFAAAQGSYPDPGTSQTNAVVQNKATGAGETATLVVKYYDEAGNLVYTNSSVTIAPKSVQEIKTENEPLPANFAGAAIISSDQPLAAVISIKNTDVPGASDGLTQGAYNGFTEGSTQLFFPSFWAFEFIVSRVTVQNTEGTAANITLDYYNRSGTYLGQVTDTLAAYGSKTYCGCNSADLPAGWPADFEDGAVTVTSTSGQKLAGASVATWDDKAGAYQALTAADQGTTLYVPSHFRFRLDSDAPGQYTLYSAINIQNTSTTTAAPVTIKYYNRDDGLLALTLTKTIQPLSAIGANTKNGGDFNAADFNPLGDDWDGSVVITSDSAIPLVGTAVTNWGTAANAGMSAIASPNMASNVLYLPAQFRLDFGSGWSQWSSLNLQNVSTVNTVDRDDLVIEYIDNNGATVGTFTGAQLPFDLGPGAALGLNTRNGGDIDAAAFNSFGLGYIGGIYITAPAGSQLVATANIIYSNRASVYNAVPGD